jgi:hypothetical protein
MSAEMSVSQMPVGQITINLMSASQMSVSQMPINLMTVDQMPVNQNVFKPNDHQHKICQRLSLSTKTVQLPNACQPNVHRPRGMEPNDSLVHKCSIQDSNLRVNLRVIYRLQIFQLETKKK